LDRSFAQRHGVQMKPDDPAGSAVHRDAYGSGRGAGEQELTECRVPVHLTANQVPQSGQELPLVYADRAIGGEDQIGVGT
jgi:hypothetical protein